MFCLEGVSTEVPQELRTYRLVEKGIGSWPEILAMPKEEVEKAETVIDIVEKMRRRNNNG